MGSEMCIRDSNLAGGTAHVTMPLLQGSSSLARIRSKHAEIAELGNFVEDHFAPAVRSPARYTVARRDNRGDLKSYGQDPSEDPKFTRLDGPFVLMSREEQVISSLNVKVG